MEFATATPSIRAVLHVEDSEWQHRLWKNVLVASGWTGEILWARNGSEALDLLERNQTRVAAAFVDLTLAGLDGLGFMQCVRSDERTVDLPCFVLTASKDPADHLAAYRHGATGIFVKPVGPANWQKIARALLAFLSVEARTLRMTESDVAAVN